MYRQKQIFEESFVMENLFKRLNTCCLEMIVLRDTIDSLNKTNGLLCTILFNGPMYGIELWSRDLQKRSLRSRIQLLKTGAIKIF